MATTAVDPTFVDTNILVYVHQTLSPFNAAATAKIQALAAAGHPLWISRQILREYLAAMSRSRGTTRASVAGSYLTDVQSFQTQFFIAEDGAPVTAGLLNLLAAVPCGGKQVHDANIVATMLTHGIPRLLTHNIADFNRFAAYITVVPMIP